MPLAQNGDCHTKRANAPLGVLQLFAPRTRCRAIRIHTLQRASARSVVASGASEPTSLQWWRPRTSKRIERAFEKFASLQTHPNSLNLKGRSMTHGIIKITSGDFNATTQKKKKKTDGQSNMSASTKKTITSVHSETLRQRTRMTAMEVWSARFIV